MDLLSMLMNARITDMDGDEIGEVFGVHIAMGKLYITVDMELDDEEEDPDDGAKDDIPEDDASNQEFPKIVVAMKKAKKTGTNDG